MYIEKKAYPYLYLNTVTSILDMLSLNKLQQPPTIRIRYQNGWHRVTFNHRIDCDKYNPLIVSLSNGTSHLNIDQILNSTRKNWISRPAAPKIIIAPRPVRTIVNGPRIAPLHDDDFPDLPEVEEVWHQATFLRSSGPTATPPRSPSELLVATSSRQKIRSFNAWPNGLLVSDMVDSFDSLGRKQKGSTVEERGRERYGPGFKRSTFYKYSDFWAETPVARKDAHLDSTWTEFMALEHGIRQAEALQLRQEAISEFIAAGLSFGSTEALQKAKTTDIIKTLHKNGFYLPRERTQKGKGPEVVDLTADDVDGEEVIDLISDDGRSGVSDEPSQGSCDGEEL